jgi:hypothetical protein
MGVNPHVSSTIDTIRRKRFGMTVYLGSPNNQIQADAVVNMPVLLSFATAGTLLWVDQYIPTWDRLLLDCGAYSAHTQGIEIDGVAYRDWVDSFDGICDAHAGIDDIGGDWRKSWENYQKYGGFPTIHDTDPPEFLDDLIELAQEQKQPWIGIGLKPPREGKECFIRDTIERIPWDMHIHGWALRAYTHIRRIDSVDSTNWWREAQTLKTQYLCDHLTMPECLEIMVKRYQRWQRSIRDDSQVSLFSNTNCEDSNEKRME